MLKQVTKTTTIQFSQNELVDLIRNKLEKEVLENQQVSSDQVEILDSKLSPLANITVKVTIQEND